jgi:hypothetical protein
VLGCLAISRKLADRLAPTSGRGLQFAAAFSIWSMVQDWCLPER